MQQRAAEDRVLAEPDAEEVTQRAAFHAMRRTATLLVVAMAALYAVLNFRPLPSWWAGALLAFSEAALIGALADWFAVTALFRHPLGLPIPHTAIVPRNQARIARNLGVFIEKHFLEPQVIRRSLRAGEIGAALGRWLASPANAALVSARIAGALPSLLRTLEDRHVAELIEVNVVQGLKRVNSARLIGDFLHVLSNQEDRAGSARHALVDEGLLFLQAFIESNNYWLYLRLNETAPWFIPNFVSQKLAGTIVERAVDLLHAVRRDPEHELRAKIVQAFQSSIDRLRFSPEYREKCDAIKEAVLQSEDIRSYFGSVSHALVEHWSSELGRDDQRVRMWIQSVLEHFGSVLLKDIELQERVTDFFRDVLIAALPSSPGGVSAAVAEIVKGWDSRTLIERLEVQVGRDLQFIRINGTIVGGLVGLLLWAVGRGLGWPQ